MRTTHQTTAGELRTNSNQNGFTLIEIVLVLSIIVLLIGAAILQLRDVGEHGKIVRTKADFGTLRTALKMYEMHAGRYPTTEQGLNALVKKPTTGPIPRSYKAPLEKRVYDPWGNPYGYRWPAQNGGSRPDVYSMGPDGIDGTADDIHMNKVDGEE